MVSQVKRDSLQHPPHQTSRSHPETAAAYKLLGDDWLNQQQWQQAQTAYEQALKLEPDSAEIYVSLGTVAVHQQHWAAAAQCYEKAVTLDPTLAIAFWNLSLAHKQLGNSEAMLNAYFQALTLQPDWATAEEHERLGNHFLQQQQWVAAIACYDRAVAQDDRLADAHLKRGIALQKQGDPAAAVSSYQQAIALNPQAWLAYHSLGDALLAQKQESEAVVAYRQSIALNPDYSWSYNNLGDAYRNLQAWDRAIEAYQQAIALNPEFHWSHYNLGDALAKRNQWQAAIEAYKKAIELEPNLTVAHRNLSRALQQRAAADLADALSGYLRLIQQDPDDLESYRGALQIKRDDPALHVGFANALMRQNQLDQAIVFYQNALLFDPDHAEAKLRIRKLEARQKSRAKTFGFAVHSADYALWLQENAPKPEDFIRMAQTVPTLKYKPLISVVVPIYNPPEQFLRDMIQSVREQIYPHWELCLADDCSSKPHVRRVLEEFAARDARIKVVYRETNGHIAAASNSALKLATGDYVTLLDHDDLLTPDALYEVVSLLNRHPEADLIYSDEDKINDRQELLSPHFKPDWCPDLLLSQNYVCHLGTYRRTIINQIGGFRVGYEGSQDYDLVLRFTEKTNNIFHIPKILYHWRIHPESVASGSAAKPYAYEAALRALQDALDRRGEGGQVAHHAIVTGLYTVRYAIRDPKLVSIIIPSRNLGDVLDRCLQSIFAKSTYPHYEVIVIDNGSDEPETLAILKQWQQREPDRFRCHRLDIPFNYSRLNNYGVSQARGDYLLFLNNDTEVITPDWIEAMVEQAQRTSVGAIGAILLYPDNTIQHAGVMLGVSGVAEHSHKHFPLGDPGYFGRLFCVSNYSAVTGACVMCRREVYEQVGGFDETLRVAYNDIDFCLKLRRQGYHNLVLSHVSLYHHESKSRGAEDTPEKQQRFQQEIQAMHQTWADVIAHDPCYNPNLTRQGGSYRLKLLNCPEIRQVIADRSSDAFLDFSIDTPIVGKLEGAFMTIKGWVLGRESRVAAIEICCQDLLIQRSAVHLLRSDVKKLFPHLPECERSGFAATIDLADLADVPSTAEIWVQAVFENGMIQTMGKIIVQA
ncbi:glycosyltransferase [Leptolyngbya ohadii]|uniref:glycosyltransferase n=1 Tax=Leptolyngbya ohadii TaxID=1962290 RepID=UPI000B59D028|nr:glycosyltransferase [Leptolyngbya ohadii]